MQIENRTPFRALALPGLDRDGREIVTVVVKGTFAIDGRRRPEAVAPDSQAEFVWADEYWGEPGVSAVRVESDLAMQKPACDLVLLGSAYAARGGSSRRFTVGFSVGQHSCIGELSSDDKGPRVPLHTMERYAVEAGWIGPDKGPLGFGYFPKSRPPRLGLSGTYDEAWTRNRSPLLPKDFDPRFFQAAFPKLIVSQALRGDEPVAAIGVTPDGELRTVLPGEAVSVRAYLEGVERSERPRLDTVVLEPEERRLILSWRWMVDVGGDFAKVRGFLIERVPVS